MKHLLHFGAAIAGLGALLLGILIWAGHGRLVMIHAIFGLCVALILLGLSLKAAFADGTKSLGILGIALSILVPILGGTQTMLLLGPMHWLIRILHLLVGLGAMVLLGTISMRLASGPKSPR